MPRFTTSAGRQNLVTLKQKQKSLADTVNDQLARGTRRGGSGRADGFDEAEEHGGGVAEDFDFDNAEGYDDAYGAEDDTNATSLKGSAANTKKTGKKSRGLTSSSAVSSRLRHRGPLDASLSEGKYAATPVNVEAAMDDLFGALDMGDMDAEGEEYFDDDGDDFGEGDDEPGGFAGDAEGESGSEIDEAVGATAAKAKKQPAAAAAGTRKRRRTKDLTEEEYTAWLEQKQTKEKKSGALHRPLSFGGSGVHDAALNSEEADILRQLSELRQTQQVSLVGPAEGEAGAAEGEVGVTTTNVAAAAAQTDAKSTRDVVQHFIMVYGQLLRLRVLLQPAVTKAIGMPQYYARSFFVERQADVEREAKATAATAEEGRATLEELAEQRHTVAERYEEVQHEIEAVMSTLYAAATGSHHRGDGEEGDDHADPYGSSNGEKPRKAAKVEQTVPSFRVIERYHERVRRHADHCLEYWGNKLVQANSAKLKTIAQPLPQQIAAILTAKTRLRTKVQKNRSHLNILAHPEHLRASTSAEVKAQRALHIAEGDTDAEIYDDADFLRELVRRGGTMANQLVQKVKEMQQQLLPSRDGARKGFHRMTKGKTVNYEPRPKLVGFMMAESLDNTERNDVVVKSLFQ